MVVNAGSPAALACHGLGKTFSSGSRVIQALDGIDLTVAPGRITGLIGPDGAGKTTLMRLAAGLLRADAGALRVLDLDVSLNPLAVQSAIGYMPQRFGLYEDLSVQENLDLYADLQGVLAAERRGRYAELLHMVGLARFTARLAGRLSGGMKQKLGLACGCCCWTNPRSASIRCRGANCGPSSNAWCGKKASACYLALPTWTRRNAATK